jgi:hypothetical protein
VQPEGLGKLEKIHLIGTRSHDLLVCSIVRFYVGVLICLWLFLFAAQPEEFFLDGLKKLEQQSHKCVELRGEHVE